MNEDWNWCRVLWKIQNPWITHRKYYFFGLSYYIRILCVVRCVRVYKHITIYMDILTKMKKSSHNNLLKYFDGTMNFDRIFIGCNRRLLLEMDCYFMGCVFWWIGWCWFDFYGNCLFTKGLLLFSSQQWSIGKYL